MSVHMMSSLLIGYINKMYSDTRSNKYQVASRQVDSRRGVVNPMKINVYHFYESLRFCHDVLNRHIVGGTLRSKTSITVEHL